MRKVIATALTALTIGGATMMTTSPAAAEGWHGGWGHGWHEHEGWGGGAVLGAGILGLAAGAAIAGSHPGYYAPPPAYYIGPTYAYVGPTCRTQYRWDPYVRRYVPVERCY